MAAASTTTVTLRYRVPGEEHRQENLPVEKDLPVKELKLVFAKAINRDPDTFELVYGHPPKKVAAEDFQKKVGDIMRRGDILTAQAVNAEVKRGHTDGRYIPPIEIRNSIFVKHDVPG